MKDVDTHFLICLKISTIVVFLFIFSISTKRAVFALFNYILYGTDKALQASKTDLCYCWPQAMHPARHSLYCVVAEFLWPQIYLTDETVHRSGSTRSFYSFLPPHFLSAEQSNSLYGQTLPGQTDKPRANQTVRYGHTAYSSRSGLS